MAAASGNIAPSWKRVEGVIAAPLTFMRPPAEPGAVPDVDTGAIAAQVEYLARRNCSGVFVNGTTGEGLLLSLNERKAVAEAFQQAKPAKNAAGKPFRLIVQVGSESPADVAELSRHAEEIGADAVAFQPSAFCAEAVVEAMQVVVRAAPNTPLFFYHLPGMTGLHTLDVVKIMDKGAEGVLPTLVGVKYSCSDLPQLRRLVTCHGGRFDILFGQDESLPAALALGVRGAVGSTYNYWPHMYDRLLRDTAAGAPGAGEAALEKVDLCLQAVKLLGGTGSYMSAAKALMRELVPGLREASHVCRLPLKSLSAEEAEAVVAAAKEAGIVDACRREW